MKTDQALDFARHLHRAHFMTFGLELQQVGWCAEFDTGAQTFYGYGKTVVEAVTNGVVNWLVMRDDIGALDALSQAQIMYAKFAEGRKVDGA